MNRVNSSVPSAANSAALSRDCRSATPFEVDKAAYGVAAATVLGGARALGDAAEGAAAAVGQGWTSLSTGLGLGGEGHPAQALMQGFDRASDTAISAYRQVAALADTTAAGAAKATGTAADVAVNAATTVVEALDHAVDNVAGAVVVALAV
jgi:hypothetical protein